MKLIMIPVQLVLNAAVFISAVAAVFCFLAALGIYSENEEGAWGLLSLSGIWIGIFAGTGSTSVVLHLLERIVFLLEKQ